MTHTNTEGNTTKNKSDALPIEPVKLSNQSNDNQSNESTGSGVKVDEEQQSCSVNQGSGPKNAGSFFIWFIVVTIIIIAGIYALNSGDSIPKPAKQLVSTSSSAPKQANDTERQFMYNSHDFLRYNNMWRTGILKGKSLYDIEFYFSPKELENIPFTGGFGNNLKPKKAYVTFDPRDKNLSYVALAIGQFDTHMIKSFGKYIVPACAVDAEGCEERPLIDCENTEDTPVYYFKEADSPSVTIVDNCVMIYGRGWDLVKATERFLMTAYSIIK